MKIPREWWFSWKGEPIFKIDWSGVGMILLVLLFLYAW